MTTKLTNFIEKLSFSEFKQKNISKEYSLTLLILLVIKLFTSVVSIASGFYFVYLLFFNMLNITALSIVFACISLALLELINISFLNKTLKFLFIKEIKQAAFTFILTLIFFSISFYISVQGIKQYTLKRNDLSANINTSLAVSIDSINNVYRLQKEAIETQIKSLQKVIQDTPKNSNLSQNAKSYIIRITNKSLEKQTNNLQAINKQISKDISEAKETSLKQLKTSNASANDKANKYFSFVAVLMIIQFIVSTILSKFFSFIYFEKESYIRQRFTSFSEQLKNTTELIVIRDMQEVYNNAILALNSNNTAQKELNTNENKNNVLGFQKLKETLNTNPGTPTTSDRSRGDKTLNTGPGTHENNEHTHVTHVDSLQHDNQVTNKHTHVTHVHGKTTCLNCNTEFEKKSHNHKFCSELCRLEYYEKRTNKNIDYIKKLHEKK